MSLALLLACLISVAETGRRKHDRKSYASCETLPTAAAKKRHAASVGCSEHEAHPRKTDNSLQLHYSSFCILGFKMVFAIFVMQPMFGRVSRHRLHGSLDAKMRRPY